MPRPIWSFSRQRRSALRPHTRQVVVCLCVPVRGAGGPWGGSINAMDLICGHKRGLVCRGFLSWSCMRSLPTRIENNMHIHEAGCYV